MKRIYCRPSGDVVRNFASNRELAAKILHRRTLARPASDDFRIPQVHTEPGVCLWDNCPCHRNSPGLSESKGDIQ